MAPCVTKRLSVARPPRSECRSRQCRVGRPVGATSSDRSERTEQNALNRSRRLAKEEDVGELGREERQLQWVRHPAPVHVSLAGEPEQRFDHVREPLTRRDLHAHDRVHVALVPPVMPDARLDVGPLAGSQDRHLTVPHHGQLALLDGETLMQSGMEVLTDNPRAAQRGQFGDQTALSVRPRQLDDHDPLQRHRVLPNLTGLDRPSTRSCRRVRMRHTPILPGAGLASHAKEERVRRPLAAGRRGSCFSSL